MKYKLIKPINPDYSTIEQILTNRGLPLESINKYINTTDRDICKPELLGVDNLKKAKEIIKEVVINNKDCLVIVDADCDGFTSSAILINFLYDLFPDWVLNHMRWYLHDGKQHGLNDCIDYILEQKYSLVICPDSSSNDFEEHRRLKEKGIECLVLDHHEAESLDNNAIIINNQLSEYSNKMLSGAGITWQFCRYIDEQKANQYLDLVALGNDADMMSMLSIETKHLINKGISNVKNPFISHLVEKNSFSLKGKLTPLGMSFYIAPFVNAMVRSGTQEEKELVFKSMLTFEAFKIIPSTKRGHKIRDKETLVEQAIRVVTNVKARQTKAQNESVELLTKKIEDQNLLKHKVLLLLLEPNEIDKNIAGLIANKFMSKYQRPVCILTKEEDLYCGSARGCDKIGINAFKDICESTQVVEYAAGHQGAFGLGITANNIQAFIEKTDLILKDISEEAIYYVDYIFNEQNLKSEKILSIAKMESLWGKDVEESLIAVEHLKVIPSQVVIYDKKGLTIKITLENGIVLMIFNASEKDCDILKNNNDGYIEINIVGKCNENEWMGRITPQIFIEDYEVIDSNKYFF